MPHQYLRILLWRHYQGKYKLTGEQIADRPDVKGWTGAEVQICCERSWDFNCTLGRAARRVIPIAQSVPHEIEALRKEANGRYASASYDGTYQMPDGAGQGGGKTSLEQAVSRQLEVE